MALHGAIGDVKFLRYGFVGIAINQTAQNLSPVAKAAVQSRPVACVSLLMVQADAFGTENEWQRTVSPIIASSIDLTNTLDVMTLDEKAIGARPKC